MSARRCRRPQPPHVGHRAKRLHVHHVAAAVRLVPAAERGDGHRRRGRGHDRGHWQCHGAGAVSAMSELVLGSCAAAVSRRWQPRRPTLALVVSSNTLSYAIVLSRCHHRPPFDQLANAPCGLPSTSSRGAGARAHVPIRAPSANITSATVRRRGQPPHSCSGNVSGNGAYAHNGWPRPSLRAPPCSATVSGARWRRTAAFLCSPIDYGPTGDVSTGSARPSRVIFLSFFEFLGQRPHLPKKS